MAEMTTKEFEAAVARGNARQHGPRAESAHYDRERDRVIVRLSTGVELGLRPQDVEGLEKASPEDLSEIEIEAMGLGLHWPRIDADLYLPAVLEGVLGSRRWMAQRLGAAGGEGRSEAKAAAARENGKKGGRPAKTAGVIKVVSVSRHEQRDSKGGRLSVERRPQGDYAVRKPNSARASAILPTQVEAIARAKELGAGIEPTVERVRQTRDRNLDRRQKS